MYVHAARSIHTVKDLSCGVAFRYTLAEIFADGNAGYSRRVIHLNRRSQKLRAVIFLIYSRLIVLSFVL